jgi:uncharacterized protein (TIGR02217 family)
MATYPGSTTITYINPVRQTIQFKTLVSKFGDQGEENRKAKWTYPRRNISVQYSALSKADAQTLWQFYLDRKGSYEAFAFFESTGVGSPYTYSQEYVGTGDSTTAIFNLPAVDSSASHVVWVDSSSQGSTRYSMSYKGGSDGEDKLTFGTTYIPSSTQKILYDFTGRLKIRCRFAVDNLTFENFYDSIVNKGITLQGLLNA